MHVRSGVVVAFAVCLGAQGCTQTGDTADETKVSNVADDLAIEGTPTSPLQLTSSDGTGLRLVRFDVGGAVQAPLAFTELRMTFENPDDRVIAGEFSIELPPGAALSRFAMKVGEQWQEGEVVERQQARRTYDAFLHNNVDPALLEKQAGNRFSAHVFPIPARGHKELILSYSQVLDGPSQPYALPLRGLPQLEQFDAVFYVDEPGSDGRAQRRLVERHEKNFSPREDLRISTEAIPESSGLRDGGSVVARVQVDAKATSTPMSSLTLAFDTSASRGAGFSGHVRRFAALVAALGKHDPDLELQVVAYDQRVAPIYQGAASGFGREHVEALLAREALGASNLDGLLESLGAQDETPQRVVLITDGIATAGPREIAELNGRLTQLRNKGLARLDVILDEVSGSDAIVGGLVTGVLAQAGTVSRDHGDPDTLRRRLGREVLGPIDIEVENAKEWWPRSAEGLQPGDTVMVYATDVAPGPVRVTLGGSVEHHSKVPTMEIPGALLSRALASARVEELTARRSASGDPALQAQLKSEIIALSTEQRVISDFTAMLVLESGSDYARFGIPRDAEVNILTVGPDGVSLTPHARDLEEPAPKPVEPRKSGLYAMRGPSDDEAGGDGHRHAGEEGKMGHVAQESGHFLASPYGGAFAVGNDDEDVWGGLTGTEVGEAFGVGGLGLVGTGRGGGGTGEGTIGLGNVGLIGAGGSGGYGRGSGGIGRRGFSRSHAVPRVGMTRIKTSKGLDRDIARRIIRAHLNEVRHCYNQGLVRDPGLSGRQDVEFSVAATGRVAEATAGAHNISDERVSMCITKAVKRWKFPKPKGGESVTVRGGFQLSPVRAATTTPAPQPRAVPRRAARPATPRASRGPESLAEMDAQLTTAYSGPMLQVMDALGAGKTAIALTTATAWRRRSPQDVMAYVALGEAQEALGRPSAAARAYGSIVDLFPSDAPLRRYAASRLQALGEHGSELALDSWREAVAQRPDHPSSHRGLAYALLQSGAHKEAFEIISAALDRHYPSRYEMVKRILLDDAELIVAAWLAAHPGDKRAIRTAASAARVPVVKRASTHFVLSWETDANDVDLHVFDGSGHHVWYQDRGMTTGGLLYADVTDGYGPESFTITGEPRAYPYRIDVQYFRKGPSGHGLGALQVIQHDGKGNVAVRTVPYSLMNDGGRVRLLTLDAPLSAG